MMMKATDKWVWSGASSFTTSLAAPAQCSIQVKCCGITPSLASVLQTHPIYSSSEIINHESHHNHRRAMSKTSSRISRENIFLICWIQ